MNEGVIRLNDAHVAGVDVLISKVDAIDALTLREGVNTRPLLAVGRNFQSGILHALEIPVGSYNRYAGESPKISELNRGGGGGLVGVETAAMGFDHAPVLTGFIPSVARFGDTQKPPELSRMPGKGSGKISEGG